MNIKLKDRDNPIVKKWCFGSIYDSSVIDKINSGKQVKVDKVPKPAWEYVEKVKKNKNENK